MNWKSLLLGVLVGAALMAGLRYYVDSFEKQRLLQVFRTYWNGDHKSSAEYAVFLREGPRRFLYEIALGTFNGMPEREVYRVLGRADHVIHDESRGVYQVFYKVGRNVDDTYSHALQIIFNVDRKTVSTAGVGVYDDHQLASLSDTRVSSDVWPRR